MRKQLKTALAPLAVVMLLSAFVVPLAGQTPSTPPASVATPLPPVKKFKATDCDSHSVFINKPGMITLLLGTNQDSQDAARAAGVATFPFRGRPDFQLIVVVTCGIRLQRGRLQLYSRKCGPTWTRKRLT